MNQKRYLDITALPITTICWHRARAVTPNKKAMMPTTLKTNNKNPYSMKKFLLYLMIPVFLLLSGKITSQAQTTLAAGDIAIIRMNEDLPSDGFSFVTLVPISAGTNIYFTEQGWLLGTWVTSVESHLLYTATSSLSAGSVVHIDETATADVFTVSGAGGSISFAWSTSNFSLSGGDQMLVYQTSNSSKPTISSELTFIGGLTFNDGSTAAEVNDATGWTSASATATTGVNVCNLPPGLSNGTTCISVFPDYTVFSEKDNARYNCTFTSGTKSALLAAINNHDNWLYDDGVNYPTSSVCPSFTVTTTSPEMNITGNSVTITDGDATPSTTDHTDFGSVAVASGTIVRTFTISNSGAGVLNLTGSPIVVSSSGEFVVTQPASSTVAASGGSITFNVTFDPSASGTRTATLSIANNDADENPYNFSISGVGTAPEPEMTVKGLTIEIVDGDATPTTTDDTDFGYADISTGSVTHTFTISNDGLATLTLSGSPAVTSSSSDFTITQPGSTSLAASGGSTTFQVTFNPSTTGTITATLSIANNDTNENPYNFTIQGYGTSQNLSAGDIAFIGYNSDDPDGFTFVTLNAIPAYEMIYFADQGWNGSAWGGDPTETHYAWQAPAAGLAIGTIVYIYESSANVLTTSSGTISGLLSGSNFFFGSGDQVLAYQSGSGAKPASPSFIAGVHTDYISTNYNSSTGWSASSSDQSSSTVPTGLSNGSNCVSLFPATTEYQNAKYNGTLTGNSNAIRTAINTYTNWIFDSATPYDISPTGYATPLITLAAEINLLGNSVSITDGDAVPSIADDTDFGSVAVVSGTVSHTFTIENTGSLALNLTGTNISYGR